ncbi:MAG: hypothetical protein L0219_22710 [Phycisphaerales bacterium]|nr:hypothetical protein [Phycisphaerales bacterium]
MRRPARKPVPKRIARIAMKAQGFCCACGCGQFIGMLTYAEVPHAALTIDHEPALGFRPINDDGSDYVPPQHDPSALRIYIRGHKIAHIERTRAKHETHEAIMRAKAGR